MPSESDPRASSTFVLNTHIEQIRTEQEGKPVAGQTLPVGTYTHPMCLCPLQPAASVAIRTKRVVEGLLPAATGPTADDCICPGSRWFPSGKQSRARSIGMPSTQSQQSLGQGLRR